MNYDEDKFKEFREHVVEEGRDFTVYFGDDYVAFSYGNDKHFPVATPPGGELATERDKRLLKLMTAANVIATMSSDFGSEMVDDN
jgi:hypothetical protein